MLGSMPVTPQVLFCHLVVKAQLVVQFVVAMTASRQEGHEPGAELAKGAHDAPGSEQPAHDLDDAVPVLRLALELLLPARVRL